MLCKDSCLSQSTPRLSAGWMGVGGGLLFFFFLGGGGGGRHRRESGTYDKAKTYWQTELFCKLDLSSVLLDL